MRREPVRERSTCVIWSLVLIAVVVDVALMLWRLLRLSR